MAPAYSRAGRPGGTPPPSVRPLRPAPYFHHPYHHHMMHMRPVFWPILPPPAIYWYGWWDYCHLYWYDWHCTDIVVVRDYVRETYHTEMITFAVSDNYIYMLVDKGEKDNFLQVFDKEDHLLAETRVSSKYQTMEIDKENGGCWLFKKHEKDPLLFFYANGELLIYEED